MRAPRALLLTLASLAASALACEDVVVVRPDPAYPPSKPDRPRPYSSCAQSQVATQAPALLARANCPDTLPGNGTVCSDQLQRCPTASADETGTAGWLAECRSEQWVLYQEIPQPEGSGVCAGLDPQWSAQLDLRFTEGIREGAPGYEATDAALFIQRFEGRFYYFGGLFGRDDDGTPALTRATGDASGCVLTFEGDAACTGSRGGCAYKGSVTLTVTNEGPLTASFSQSCEGETSGRSSGSARPEHL